MQALDATVAAANHFPRPLEWTKRYLGTALDRTGPLLLQRARACKLMEKDRGEFVTARPNQPTSALSPVGHNNRRAAERFPMSRDLRYKVLNKRGNDEAGEGQTINMSSSGLLFTAAQMLLPGRRVEVSVSWPAQLNNSCALKLVAQGRVVRFENGRVAVEIQKHEFRTAGNNKATLAAVSQG